MCVCAISNLYNIMMFQVNVNHIVLKCGDHLSCCIKAFSSTVKELEFTIIWLSLYFTLNGTGENQRWFEYTDLVSATVNRTVSPFC